MHRDLYSSALWRITRRRALARDGSRCTVGRLLGGDCSGSPLHVHHIVPVAEGGSRFDLDNLLTACASHHPRAEALRRTIIHGRDPQPRRCTHEHRTREAREICERRMARSLAA